MVIEMGLILKATRLELIKIFSRWRTYIGFATILVLVPVIMGLVRKYGFGIEHETIRSLGNTFQYVGSLANGLLISYYLMNVLWVHFPFFIVLVAGDIMAGEGAAGTYRLWLTRPIGRFQVVSSKFLATFIYTLIIVLFLGICCVGLGMLIVGGGDLFVFDKGILILSQGDAFQRFLLAYLIAAWVQMTVAALAFMFSAWTSNAVGPIIGTYAVIAVSLILVMIDISALDKIRPYLFVSYFDVFFMPFSDPIPWGDIGANLFKLTIFIAVFFGISAVSFLRKDICS